MRNKNYLKYIKLLSLFLFIGVVSNSQVSNQEYKLDDLDSYFESARKEWKIPGMAIAIVKNNEIIFAKGYGVKDIRTNKRVDKNTLFGIASNTKAFTAASIMKLVEQNKLNLDDRVIDYLPYFELYDPYVTNEITIRDLLCHRSGLETFSGDLIWYASSYSREEVIKRAKYLKPTSSFRSKYGYSNILYLTAGQIVTEVSGTSWDEFVKQNFFKPLEMNSTNTSISINNEKDNIAIPHFVNNNEVIPIKFISWDNMAPAGGINSSVSEMANWLIANLNKGKFGDIEILSEQSIKEMQTPQTINRTSQLDPSMHFHAYGLGWDLFDYYGKLIVNHSGGLDGMISHIALIPEENIGFIVLTNSNNYLPSALMYKVLDFFINGNDRDWSKEYLEYQSNYNNYRANSAKEEEKNRLKKTKPSLNLSEYTGLYGGDLYGNARVSLVDNKLEIDFIPTPVFNCILNHWHLNTFELVFKDYPSLPNGKVQFILNTEGKVTEFKVDVPNPDFDFTELKFKKITE